MSRYLEFEDKEKSILEPHENLCGTTLCVAGFAAWLDGWALTKVEGAEKGDRSIWIDLAGAEALDIVDTERNIFLATEEVALAVLTRMANKEEYHDDMIREYDDVEYDDVEYDDVES